MLGPELTFIGQTEVLFEGKQLTFFGGNDYHRLSCHPEVLAALTAAAAQYGLNGAGSRVTTGNHPLYRSLEARLAAFLGTEAAVICSAGYLSATLLMQAVADAYTHLFLDEFAHASLVDAARLSGLPLARFRHADPESLKAQLAASLQAQNRPLVLTDGVFSNSGVIPPLADYGALLERYDGRVLVDDAHGVGVVGPTGKGSGEESGAARERLYQVGTLSKGFGGFGGVIAGDHTLVNAIRTRSGAFIGSTPPPLPVVAATLCAIDLLATQPERIALLQERARTVKSILRELGFAVSEGCAPICSVTFLDAAKNRVLYDQLLSYGIYPSFINYPGCPPGGHFRFTLSSAHMDFQIDALLQCLRENVRLTRPSADSAG